MPVEILDDGDLFAMGVQTIVNPVNCQGVMGKGLAKAFADRFPAHLAWYRQQCDRGLLAPGRPQLDRGQDPWILAFPTKAAWRHPSRIEDIEAGLLSVTRRIPGSGVQSIAFPALGCGLGGLPWPQVRKLMISYLSRLDLPVWVIAPR